MTTNDDVLTVKRLHEMLTTLLLAGDYGDLPIYIAYEGVAEHARVATVVRRGRSDRRGVFIDAAPPRVAIAARDTQR